MADRIVGSYVFDEVKALFAAREDLVEVRLKFGWREPTKRIEGMKKNRVIFMPGDTSGKLGKLNMAKYPGATEIGARPLGTIDELFTIYCYGFDPELPEDEEAQYNAARLLWDDCYAALWKVMHGQFRVDELAWSNDISERRSGAEIRALVILQARIPDTFDDDVITHAEKVSGLIAAPNGAASYEVTL